MLSDEEKKAIEDVKEMIELYKDGCLITTEDDFESLEILLNLIGKQSKEIEHQKEKRENQKKELAILNAKQIEFNKLVNTVNSYKGQFKRQQKELEELKEDSCCMTTCLRRDKEKLFLEDKIKAKIEYLLKRYDTEEDFCSYDVLISILKSLLEKE